MHETVRELLRTINILNVYQINILNNTILMHQISTKTAPVYFYPNSKSLHICIQLDFPTLITLSQLTNLINVKFRISVRELYLWNEFLTQTEKEIESTSNFKILVKQKLLSSYNELSHF